MSASGARVQTPIFGPLPVLSSFARQLPATATSSTMNVCRFLMRACLGLLPFHASLLCAQSTGTALVRHAPTIHGTVDGSVQQMLPEPFSLTGGGRITGDLLVPGMPVVQATGGASYGGTIDG